MIFTASLIFDYVRNSAYLDFLKENAKDKIIVDCGSGSGIWTWVALAYGAKHVYCIDIHKPTLEHLNKLYSNNSKVSVLELDLFNSALPKGDIYIHEIFADDPFYEGLLSFLRNCKRQGIHEIFPSHISLFHHNTIDYNLESREYDWNYLDPCIQDFIKYIEDSYNEKLDFQNLIKLLKCSSVTYSNKDLIWNGHLLELIEAPDLNIKGTGFISWEAHLDNYSYKSINESFNNWRGFLDSVRVKRNYLQCLALNSKDALKLNCTYKHPKKFKRYGLNTLHTQAKSVQL